MSSSISILFNITIGYEEFVAQVEQLLQVKFVRRDDVPWKLSTFHGLGIRIALIGDLDYEDDMGIAFSQYSYELDIMITHRDREEIYWQQLEYSLAMTIYSRIREAYEWKCIVLDDMEKLLAGN